MKESLTVNSFCVTSDRTETKNFASLYVGVPISERIGHGFSHSFTCFTNAVSHDFHAVRRINFKVFGLVFLFIIHLRFPRSQYIADVIRKRFGDKTLKNVRKFERLDYQVRKC